MASYEAIVIGGGISGLSFAHRCAVRGMKALVLEKSPALGGCIHSERFDTGYWLELGAHTCYNSYGGFIEMIEARGLRDRMMPRAKVPFRLLRDGELRSIVRELHWLELLRNAPRLFFAGKDGQTVESYYSKIVGTGNYERVLSPMLAAVPSQNADAFPADMLFKKRPRRKDMLRSFTLSGGLQTLVDGLAEEPGLETETGVEVLSLAEVGEGFEVRAVDGRTFDTRLLGLAVPPATASQLLADISPDLAASIGRIRTSSVETVGVVIEDAKLKLPPVAGIVATQDLFYSAVSRDIVPDERYRGFAFHFRPETEQAERIARITSVLGVERRDLEELVERQVLLPSPVLGHAELVKEIDRLTAGRRLTILGNYFAGLAIEDCVGRSFGEFARLQSDL